MASLKLRRIRTADSDSTAQIAALRNQIASLGDVVSPRSRDLTVKVFGEPLTPAQVVERICADVRDRQGRAVIHYTEELDRVRLTPETLRVNPAELSAAHAAVDSRFLEVIRRVRTRIMTFQLGVLHRDAVMSMAGRHELRLRYRPLRRVGVCVPGGGAAYPSTLLMTICPAQAAGVRSIAVVMPPTATGAGNRHLLATCHELGVSEVYRVGGAQAVAMLAYGIENVSPVDMIVGPGNLFVTLAKKRVFGQVGIDCLAGPSEIVIVADQSARAEYVAADLIAQAEHAPGVCLLVSWHAPLLDAVETALEEQLALLPRGPLARDSLESYGALIHVGSSAEAVQLVNGIAPEHLHIETDDPAALAEQIDCAGAIFLGHFSPVALGDYAAGPSHVLPTGSTARFASGLTANDFLRRSSVLQFTPAGMAALADEVQLLAEIEGLTGHSASVEIRSDAAGRNGVAGPSAASRTLLSGS